MNAGTDSASESTPTPTPTPTPAPTSTMPTSAPLPSRRGDPLLRGLAVLAVVVLAIGLWQKPGPWMTPRSRLARLLVPIEINPVARLPLVPVADLHALSFDGDQEGYAVGESGTMLRTQDQGDSWSRVPLPEALSRSRADLGLYAVAFSREGGGGYVTGRYGTILSSAPGTDKWTQLEFANRARRALAVHEEVAQADLASSAPLAAPKNARIKIEAAATAATGSGGGSSTWDYNDVHSLALSEDNQTLYCAGSDGLVALSLAKSELAESIARGDIRAVGVDGRGLAYAGPAGLTIRIQERPERTPTELIRPGAYTALAVKNGLLLAAGDRFWFERIGGDHSWVANREGKDAMPVIRAVALSGGDAGWAVGEGGAIWRVELRSLGAGRDSVVWSVRRDVPGFAGTLFAVWAFGPAAVVAGQDGAIFRTMDEGATWQPLTRNCWSQGERADGFYLRLPAPWCWLALGFCVVAGWRRWRVLPATVEERNAVAEELSSDRPLAPGEADRLGFSPFVRGLSAYLRNTATQAPLTLAVTGAWGAGKSSFMNLLREDLNRHGLRTVWFNAWHHQQEPQILVPLLSAIQAEAAPPLLSDQLALALRFRGRLLWRRVQSQRLLLLGAGLLLCFAVGVGAALHWRMPWLVLSEWLEGVVGDKPEENLGKLISGGSLAGTVLGLLLFVWRALKTFGVNPSALLATEAGKTSEQALQAQTSFRREFAAQFSEVTGALEPYPLVIFIDDLDRCDVNNVFQILEAINYLVSNGPCFVVLGMSEERVRDCVAMGFKDLPVDFGEAIISDEQDESKPREIWARQRALAQNYLEKLVQLRIEVPRPDVRAVRQLAGSGRPAAVKRDWRAEWAFRWWRRQGLVLLGVLLLGGAYALGRWIAPQIQPPEAVAEPTPVPVAPVAAVANGGAAVGQPAAKSPPDASLHLYSDRAVPPVAVRPGLRAMPGALAVGGLGLVGLVFAVWLAENLWRRRRSVVVKDSREFSDACGNWTEALYRLQGEKLTPRALKRFKNRVRFYAMMRSGGKASVGPLGGVNDANLVAIGAAEQLGFLRSGELNRESLDLDQLMDSALSEGQKEEITAAFGSIKEKVDWAQTMLEVRRILKTD